MNDVIYKTNYKPVGSSTDLSIADGIKTFSKHVVNNPTISYMAARGHHGNRQFMDHEYDLYEYGRIIDTEALVARTFQKKKTLVFKQGFRLVSKNDENLKYIKQRINEIEYVSKTPFRRLLREIAQNLINFHNSYLVKVRKEDASTGKVRKYRNKKTVDPIAGYFSIPPESVQVRPNEAGEVKRFRQYVTGNKFREFPEENVIHSYYNRRTGFLMGTPPLEAVKDDILALRRIEESVETLIYKSLFPIVHVQVGTEKHPAKTLPNGVSEVSAATRLLENIEDNGGVVTSERVQINAIGSESLALRVESYLDHFKKRVFAGLGMSGIDFGDGDATGRATGEVLSAALADSVIDYQVELEELVTREIFDELLLESGRYDTPYDISEEDRVFLELRHRSADEQIKKESHTLNLMNAGLLLHNEGREEIGRVPLTEDQMKEMFAYRNQKYMDELEVEKSKKTGEDQATQQIKVAKAAPKPTATASSGSKPKAAAAKKTATGNSKGKSDKGKAAANSSKSKTAPKNQNSKDSIIGIISNLVDSKASTERLIFKSHRLLSDFGMLAMTYGIIDSSECMDPELDTEIRSIVIDMIDSLESSQLNSIKISSIVGRAIDKTTLCVNNMNNNSGKDL
jgi:hypothetical protein